MFRAAKLLFGALSTAIVEFAEEPSDIFPLPAEYDYLEIN